MVIKSFFITIIIVFGLVAPAAAQDTGTTIAFEIDVDEAALKAATDTAELVSALRHTTNVRMAAPQDSFFWVDYRGYAGDPKGNGQMAYLWLPSTRIALNAGQSIEGISFADAVRESHGEDFPDDGDKWFEQDSDDWNEEGAWDILTEAIDDGLPATSEDFGDLPEGQHQKLRVTGVEVREFDLAGDNMQSYYQCCYDDVSGPTLVLQPDLGLDREFAMDGSSRVRLDVLIVSLEATEAPSAPPPPDTLDAARQLAGMGCSQFSARGGEAEITFNGETLKGRAEYMNGPAGQVVAMIGAKSGDRPDWCLTVFTAEPVEGTSRYPVTDAGTLMATRSGVTAVMLDLRGEMASYYATGGVVALRAEDLLFSGRLDLEGMLSSPDPGFQNEDGQPAAITGWFDAEAK